VIPASGISDAEEFIDRAHMHNPEGILLHIGVNDIGNGAEPAALSDRILKLAIRAHENFACPVYISAITPLSYFEKEVNRCNDSTRKATQQYPGLSFISNRNINSNHLADDRHLSTNGPFDRPNGRDLLVENFVEATLKTRFSLHDIKGTLRNRFKGRRS
jgi:hypothetical protein